MDTFDFSLGGANNGIAVDDSNAQLGFTLSDMTNHYAGTDGFLNQDLDDILNESNAQGASAMGSFAIGNYYQNTQPQYPYGNGEPRMFEQNENFVQPEAFANFTPSANLGSFPFLEMAPRIPANTGFKGYTHTHSLPRTSMSEDSTKGNSSSTDGKSQKSSDSSAPDDVPITKPTRGRPKKDKSKQPPSKEEQERTRQRFLDRNRKAASKCRMRKKEWQNNLQEKQHALSQERAALQREVEQLVAEKAAIMQAISTCAPHYPPFQDFLDGVLNAPTPKPLPQFMTREGSSSSTISQMSFGTNDPGSPDTQLSDKEFRDMNVKQVEDTTQSAGQSPGNTSSIHDSGISDMGTPPNKGSSEKDTGVVCGNKMMGNPRITRQTRSGEGPADLIDPAIFIQKMKVEGH